MAVPWIIVVAEMFMENGQIPHAFFKWSWKDVYNATINTKVYYLNMQCYIFFLKKC